MQTTCSENSSPPSCPSQQRGTASPEAQLATELPAPRLFREEEEEEEEEETNYVQQAARHGAVRT